MATTTSMAPPANLKVVLAALLCAAAAAAAFLPVSSAAAVPSPPPPPPPPPSPLMSQTCRRTSIPRVCLHLLQSYQYSNRSGAATTVRELAVVAVTAARKSVLSARLHAPELLSDDGAPRTLVDGLVGQCVALYVEGLSAGSKALATVATMRTYDERAADAVSSLRRFPETCEGLFYERRIASPLAQVNRDLEEKLGVAAEVVRLSR